MQEKSIDDLVNLSQRVVTGFDEIGNELNSIEKGLNQSLKDTEAVLKTKSAITDIRGSIEKARIRIEGISDYADQLEKIQDIFSLGISKQLEASSLRSEGLIKKTAKKGSRLTTIVAAISILITLIFQFFPKSWLSKNELKPSNVSIIEEDLNVNQAYSIFSEKEEAMLLGKTNSDANLEKVKVILSNYPDITPFEIDSIQELFKINRTPLYFNNEEIELFKAYYSHLRGQNDLAKKFLGRVADASLLPDKELLLAQIQLQKESPDKLPSSETIKGISWLGITREIYNETAEKIKSKELELVKILVLDATAGKNNIPRDTEAKNLKLHFTQKGWKNVYAEKFYYNDFALSIDTGLISRLIPNNVSDHGLHKFKQDISKLWFFKKVRGGFYKSYNPNLEQELRQKFNDYQLIVILGVEYGGANLNIPEPK